MENLEPKLEQTLSLPKLPVPELQHTLMRYRMTMQPLLTPEQMDELNRIAEKFLATGGEGQLLQEALLRKREKEHNWAFQYWLHSMYLRVPLALPVNSNPGMVFPRREFPTNDAMLIYMAQLVHGAYQWKVKLNSVGLPIDRCSSRDKGQPLCMEQYHRVMTTYRRPGRSRDYQLDTSGAQSQFVIVCCGGQQFQLVLTEDWEPLSVDEIAFQLRRCQEVAAQSTDAPQVALLTSDDRRRWAENREALIKADHLNAETLATIENCLFIVCLDEPLPTSFNGRKRVSFDNGVTDGRDDTAMAHQMLHGGGTLFNTANRWFDKTIQMVVSSDGVSGLCYEHSAAEGIAVVQLMEQLVAAAERDDVSLEPPSRPLEPPNQLEWFLNDDVRDRIEKSTEAVDRLIDDLDFLVLRFPDYGKSFIKSVKCSPDAYLQLALQLAYYRLHDDLVSTYESASTRRFRQGRVDCIRAVTPAVHAWVKVMEDINASRGRKLQLFRAALHLQTEIMVENILGQGIDIHLLGLQEMASDLGLPTPALFSHESFRIANHFGLSTSQVPTQNGEAFMGYGAVVPDGYGCSYNPHPDFIIFCIGSFHSCDMTSSEAFGTSIQESLGLMYDLLKSDAWTSSM